MKTSNNDIRSINMNSMTATLLRKLTALLFAFIIFLTPSAVYAATLSLTPSTATVNKNCTFEIKINLNTQAQETDGTDVILNYDTTKFQVTTSSIVNGTIYSDYPGNSVSNGRITISGIAPAAQPYNGSGTFATLNVSVLSTAAGTGTFKFDFDPNDKIKTIDTNVVQGGADPVDILSAVTDGSYTIGSGTTCTGTTGGSTGGSTSGSGLSGGGTAGSGVGAGVKTLPAGGQGGTAGFGGLAGGPATDSALPNQLPAGGLEGPTLIFVVVGGVLTVIGLLGLVLL